MFIRFFAFFLFVLDSICFGGLPKNGLINADGSPSDALLEILDYFGVSHDGTLPSILQETQKEWLNTTQERWEFEPRDDPDPERSYSLFTNLFMTQPFFPKKLNYDYGVVLGGTLQAVRHRFWFLKQRWDRGLRFQTLVVLTGDRPLAPQIENKKTLTDSACCPYPFRKNWKHKGPLPRNETEMTQLVFDQLDLPESWQQMDVIFIDTPCPNGSKRPNTADTVDFWMLSNPDPGSILLVSSQPFLRRQDLIARKKVSGDFRVETIGKGISLKGYQRVPRALAVLLDELARCIYETKSK